jgi:dTDP-4-amino-4,6-dideoxygalactose transaminase
MSDQIPIYVTRPSLPPLSELVPYLQQICDSQVVTNCGPFHKQLEQALCEYLGVPYISLFTNGTIALVTALQALQITGEVITTPFSFAATSHSLLWNNIKPVFVDIDKNTLNINPNSIEAAITPETSAILAVHCYGRPCEVDAIQRIADSYSLKVIYDAAHAFGVQCHCGSVLNHGDLSVLSFHATKVFNTFEGGAIICPDAEAKQRIDQLKNFGFVDEVTVVATGINGKLSEFNAALGLVQLKYLDDSIARRRTIYLEYCQRLSTIIGINCVGADWVDGNNFAYFPVLITNEYPLSRDALYKRLQEQGVFARRYFYPLISDMPPYRAITSGRPTNLPVAQDVANRILCLPIYDSLEPQSLDRVCDIVAAVQNG